MPTVDFTLEDLKTTVQAIVDQSINARFEQFEAAYADDMSAIQAEFLNIYSRFNAIDERFETMDARFDAMDVRFDAMDARFDAMDIRFDRLEKRVGKLEINLDHYTHRTDKLLTQHSHDIMMLRAQTN